MVFPSISILSYLTFHYEEPFPGKILPISIWIINFAILLFFIGVVWLLLNWKNLLITLLCVELMYLGIVLAFIFVGITFNDPSGYIYSLIFVVLAASESAIGLGVLIILYGYGQSIDFIDYQELKG